MANIKSAKKRVLVNRKKAERNKSIKSAVKTSIKKVEVAIEAKDKEAAVAALQNAISTIDKAATKGVGRHQPGGFCFLCFYLLLNFTSKSSTLILSVIYPVLTFVSVLTHSSTALRKSSSLYFRA